MTFEKINKFNLNLDINLLNSGIMAEIPMGEYFNIKFLSAVNMRLGRILEGEGSDPEKKSAPIQRYCKGVFGRILRSDLAQNNVITG